MPPTLDLSGTTHAKVIVSPARLNLRRAASYTHDRGPMSATSSRFSFNHLLFASPPPSPCLPQLVSRPRKPSAAPRPSRVFRVVFWTFGFVMAVYLAAASLRRANVGPALSWSHRPEDEYEMVGQDALPGFPTPIMVTDRRGRAKWTVSSPPNYDFPLSTKEYLDVCSKCHEVSDRVREMHHGHQVSFGHHGAGGADQHFVDIHEAELEGYLPGSISVGTLLSQQRHDGELVGVTQDSLVDRPVCGTSMTYVLASADAGLGRTLVLLWMAYALAQKEGLAFFIDDSRWAYGRFTGIFQTPPVPRCRPPLRHHMLPCPRHARHLVVTTDTASDVLGGAGAGDLPDGFSDKKAVFDLIREGYRELFLLNHEDAKYVSRRVADLRVKTRIPGAVGKEGKVIGMHVRRGDRHPYEFQYRDSYIPMNLYTERAREMLNDSFFADGPIASEMQKGHSMTIVASDDPTVYEADEFAGSARAQEQIRLASKAAAAAGARDAADLDRGVMHKFVDETVGWEGGFFAAMFWNLGLSSLGAANAAKAPALMLAPSEETMRLRSLIGRAYMMDLAVLAEASNVVICTVSAMGCRLLAIMMGWEAAVDEGNWGNIDGDYEWTGSPW